MPPLLTLKRRLRADAITHNGFTLARALELDNQWSCIVGNGPIGVLDWEYLVGGSIAGFNEFGARVDASIDKITEFVQQVVLHRRDFSMRGVEKLGAGRSTCPSI